LPIVQIAVDAQIEPCIRRLEALITRGGDTEKVWEEIARGIEKKARVAPRESMRLAELGQMIPAERAMALVEAIMLSVRRHVAGRGILARIGEDLQQLMDAPSGPSKI
jgi:hypothetical protein